MFELFPSLLGFKNLIWKAKNSQFIYLNKNRREAEDKIEDLAKQTNGKSYFIDDNDSSQGLNDAFVGSLTYQPAVPSNKITVLVMLNKIISNPVTNPND